MDRPLTAWWITTGEAGFRTQARGLAEAAVPGAVEKTIGLRAPWSLAPPGLWRATLRGLDPAKDRLAPPWPDLVVSCGRRAAKAAIAVKRASGGRTLAVHVQNPLMRLSEFDLVIPMRHDAIAGDNVLPIDLALHDVTPQSLADAGRAWAGRLSSLPRPLTGVLLGGSTRRHPFTADLARDLAQTLKRLGGGLAITPSRRTPEDVKAALQGALTGQVGVYLWDQAGDNPYRGILALSDRIVATSDSVSMVSEAVASGHPTAVFDLGGGRRHGRFIDNLVERRIVSRIEDGFLASQPALNATPQAVEAVRSLMRARLG
jgi:mitochondrial fission protein ELM1